MSLIGLLAAVIVIALAWWALTSLMSAFKVEDPIATVVKVIFVVIVIYWFLSEFFAVLPPLRLR